MPSQLPANSLFLPSDDRVQGYLVDPVDLAEALIQAPHRVLFLQGRPHCFYFFLFSLFLKNSITTSYLKYRGTMSLHCYQLSEYRANMSLHYHQLS